MGPGRGIFKKKKKRNKNFFGKLKFYSYRYHKLKHMSTKEIKEQVAKLMVATAQNWKKVYGKEEEATQEEKDGYTVFREEMDKKINSLIPEREKLSICLSGCAKGDLSHYDMEDTLKMFFKPGEGVQYDSESGQFWMYVKPSLVQKVLGHIDYLFPGGIDLNVSPNRYATNPWFQNWTQAERYLAQISAEAGE